MRRNFTLTGQTHVSQLRASHPQDASPRLPWIPQQNSKNRVIIITLRGCLSIHSTLVTLRGLQTASNRIPGAIRTFWHVFYAFATIHGANPRNPMLTYGPRPPCTPLLPEQTTTRRYLIFIYVYMYFLNMSLFTQIAALYAHIS